MSIKFSALAVLIPLVAGLALPGLAIAQEPDPHRYIVSFTDKGRGENALRAAGARVELSLDRHDAAAAHIPPEALRGLRNNPVIRYIEPDPIRVPLAQTTPWGIPAVQADLVSDTQGATRTICIIDSGYWNGHEDLPVLDSTNASQDAIAGDPFVDQCGHGTHVAGTIAALDNSVGVLGILPGRNLNLHIVKTFGASCDWTYSSSLIAALDRCVVDGSANIVNMSLGGGVRSLIEEQAFIDAENQGILSIAAAGNDGNTANSYPASYDSVVSVAAVDSALQIAAFSQQNDQVELAAPGVAVRSAVQPGTGFDESVVAGGLAFEPIGMDGSPVGSGAGLLFECGATDGLGSPGDCAGASGAVCLIRRGIITFAEKVTECQDQGGVGAVIYNNVPGLFRGTLGGAVTNIPSVGVSDADGAALRELVGQNATVTFGVGNYDFLDGTSMATPHVSGVAALVWSRNLTCTNRQIRSALARTALDLGPPGRDNAYGHGLVQALAAVDSLYCGGGGGPTQAVDVTDINGDGVNDLASLVWDGQAGRHVLRVTGAQDGAVRSTSILPAGLTPLAMDVAGGPGMTYVGTLSSEDGGRRPRVDVKDATDLSIAIRTTHFFDDVWTALDMVTTDVNGDGADDFAVLARNDSTGEIAAQIRSGVNGSFIKNNFFLNASWTPLQLLALPETDDLPGPELAVLATSANGQIVIMIKDAATNTVVRNVFFLNSNWQPIQAAWLSDFSGNGAPELALLAAEKTTGKLVVMIKDAATNTFLRNVFPLGLDWTPVSLVVIPEEGDAADVAVLGVSQSSGKPVAQVRDSQTGTFVRNLAPLGAKWAPATMVLTDHIGSGTPGLAVAATRKADDIPAMQVLDAVTGSEVSAAVLLGGVPPNSEPVADAGPDASVTVGQQVQLDGTGSTDADGDLLEFAWSLEGPPGSSSELVDPASATPGFAPDRAGEYIATLTVSDGLTSSPPDSVIITAIQ